MKFTTHIMMHANAASLRGDNHFAAGLVALLKDALKQPEVPLILPRRPGVFGEVHPLDQLKATSLPYNESNQPH